VPATNSANLIQAIVVLVASSVGFAPAAMATPLSFTTFDPPGSTYTQPEAINDAGQITGYYYDSTGQNGFLDAGGVITNINPPGSTTTYALSINSVGEIAGYYYNNTGIQGFLYDAGTYTSIAVPGSTQTYALSINTTGQITGYYFDSSGYAHGFLYSAGTLTTFSGPPGSIHTFPIAINDVGQIVGGIVVSGGFIDTAGVFVGLGPNAAPRSINDSGQVTGDAGSQGFLYSAGTFTTFGVPGSTSIIPESINGIGPVSYTHLTLPTICSV